MSLRNIETLTTFFASLLPKVLNGIPDQDAYYDVVDSLEEQGMEKLVRKLLNERNCSAELSEQLNVYEAVLSSEDGHEIENLSKMANVRSAGIFRQKSSVVNISWILFGVIAPHTNFTNVLFFVKYFNS